MNGLSVIIPIYNVEEYILECLQTISKSKRGFSNVQIILVDDGTKDKSGEIAQDFVKKDSSFFYVKKQNGGLSDARNFGLKYAKYNYVSFIDSDDFIEENYFSEVFKEINMQPDMIIFDWLDVHENNSKIVKGIELPNHLWSVQPSAWNKVYKKTLFDNISFPKGKIYEDVGTIYKLLNAVKSYKYIEKPLYCYRKNRGGSILSTISPKINDIYEVLEDTYRYYEKNNMLSEDVETGLCYQYVKLLMWSNMYRQLKYYKFNLIGFHLKMNYTRQLINKRFKNWSSNKFLLDNEQYFISRYGEKYIDMIDKMGKHFWSTLFSLNIIVFRNLRRE